MVETEAEQRELPEWLQKEPDAWWDALERRRRFRHALAGAAVLLCGLAFCAAALAMALASSEPAPVPCAAETDCPVAP